MSYREKVMVIFVPVNTTMAHGGVELSLYLFLNLATDGGQVVTFMPWLLYPQGKNLCYSRSRRLGGPRAALGTLKKR
jgi:hypothetical protein